MTENTLSAVLESAVAANDEKPVHQAGPAPASDERGVAQMAIK